MTDTLMMLPPRSIEAEHICLGAMLFSKRAAHEAMQGLDAEDFYLGQHQRIFAVARDLWGRGDVADVQSVGEALRQAGALDDVGGQVYLSQLVDAVPTESSVPRWVAVVREKSVLRQAMQLGHIIAAEACDEEKPARELIGGWLDRLVGLAQRGDSGEFRALKQIMREEVDVLEAVQRAGGRLGITSGLKDLDEITGGWRRGELTVLAGITSHGKTSALVQFADAASEAGHRVAMFSLEQSSHMLAQRFISRWGRINSIDLRRGSLDGQWEQVIRAAAKGDATPIWVNDTRGMSAQELSTQARLIRAKEGVDLIIVDYLTKIRWPRAARSDHEAASGNIRALFDLAGQIDVPVVVAAQFSRAADRHMGDPRPRISDLRDSGVIEQDADLVIVLYRPGKGGKTELERAHYQPHESDVCEFIVGKNRNGVCGTAYAIWDAPHMSFKPCARREEE